MELSTVLCLLFLIIFPIDAKLNSLHPNLYFNENDVPRLRKQAQTTHRHIAEKLYRIVHKTTKKPSEFPPSDWERFSSKWNENYGNNLCGLAFYCLLNDKDIFTRKYVFKAMDVFVKLSSWRVKASLRDDVPVAHSLNGMATAYDFLYPYMTRSQKDKYIQKIATVTEQLYIKTVKKKRPIWWSNTYIQNHVATNYAALLTGALVVSRHERYSKNAKRWISKAHGMLSRTMYLLQYVVDGSMNEGVSYGSYTTRSLTQYLFLAKRHLKVDLTKNIWLQEHFEFMYYTTMHNFNQTIGIADSARRWFYGPVSQLYFLDSFVLKNGYANWLADQIEMASNRKSPTNKLMTMIHTEFLFYNASIVAKAPPDYHQDQLHTFSDWGVAVYRSGLATRGYGNKSVYLSFKCGVLHGEAVNQMVIAKHPIVTWLRGWRSFNPGHEHVDQGTFVFAPNGVPFITDTYYGPKYTWLNNAIMFGPSSNSPCSSPLEGQIGECATWFNFQNFTAWRARGKMVTSTTEEGLVLMCGEMAGWYRKDLGLASVYRCLVLLSPGLLLVVDHVERKNDSIVQQMNAFFHNAHNNNFYTEKCWEESKYACAASTIDNKRYRVMVVNSHGTESAVHTGSTKTFINHKKLQSNFINTSTSLHGRYTRAAYLFTGPGNEITSLRINRGQDHGVYVSVAVQSLRYTVALVTKHALPLVRYRWLGFGGFGKVNIEERSRTKNAFVHRKVVQFGMGSYNKTHHKPRKRHVSTAYVEHSLLVLFIPATVICVMVLLYFQLARTVNVSRSSLKCLALVLITIYGVVSLTQFFRRCTTSGSCFPTSLHQRVLYDFTGETKHKLQPFVVYTSLPWAGSELMGEVFKSNSDFFQFDFTDSYFLQASLINVSFLQERSSIAATSDFFDICSAFQTRQSNHKANMVSDWFRKYHDNLFKLKVSFPQRAATSLPAVNLKDPGWALRFHWLRRIMGMRMKAIVIVRDPRSWVTTWLTELKVNPTLLANAIKSINVFIAMGCSKAQGENFAQELKIIQSVLHSVDRKQRNFLGTRLLAQLWAAHSNALLRMSKIIPKDQMRIIKLEDLILRPKKTVQRIYNFLSMSVPPLVNQRLQQLVRTKQFKFVNTHETIGPDMIYSWKKALSSKQIREVENICSLVMTQLNYAPSKL